MLAQVRLLEASQLIFDVAHQHLKRIVIEKPADCRDAIARHDAVRAILGKNLGVRIEQRACELIGRADCADVGEIRSITRARILYAVAREAFAFPGDDGAA
jgi:hypothetical protein